MKNLHIFLTCIFAGSLLVASSVAAAPPASLKPGLTPELQQKLNNSAAAIERNKAAISQQHAVGAKKIPQEYVSDVADRSYKEKSLYVFISSSMPDAIVRRYIESSQEINKETIFVLRGFIGGMKEFGPTKAYVTKLLCGDLPPGSPGCKVATVDVNPNLFKMFGVDRVPTIVYVPAEQEKILCSTGDIPSKWFTSIGDANLMYHMSQIEKKEARIGALIKKFKVQYHDKN